ncbi:MAG TPA: diaminopimelate epimerase [Burkholderiaceae bacterium]|nr:diaminopimelate epimerase [Burkholderiaceae bacterium]
MRLRFTKMQGAGNDFVMLDGIGQRLELDAQRLRRLADRRYGVGADQILVVEPAPDASADFRYRIFNADGGEVEQCGNGARCFVKFVRELGLTRQRSIRVLTAGGRIEPHLEDDGTVSVDMGAPNFDPAACGFDTSGLTTRQQGDAAFWQFCLGASKVAVCVVSMGNPHAVQLVDDVAAAPVASLGPQLEQERRFAHGVNAGFMQLVDRSNVRLRVWERGAGETLSCGTGACAAAVVGIRMGVLDSPVNVHTRGGLLRIQWDKARDDRQGDAGSSLTRQGMSGAQTASVRMSGPAEKVFDGEIDLP